MKTFATLGGVKLELATVDSITETLQWEYKAQETVADVAAIQFAGAKPRTLDIKALLMAAWCVPEDRHKELKEKAKKIAPLPLILANGSLLGYFVITELQQTWLQTDQEGNIIAVELAIKLMEGDSAASANAAAADAAAAQAKAASKATKGVKAAKGAGKNPLQAIRETIQTAQQGAHIPTADEALRKAIP